MKKKDLELAALKAVGDYFKTQGWNMAVAQFASIEQGDSPCNYRLVIKFVGGKFKSKEPRR